MDGVMKMDAARCLLNNGERIAGLSILEDSLSILVREQLDWNDSGAINRRRRTDIGKFIELYLSELSALGPRLESKTGKALAWSLTNLQQEGLISRTLAGVQADRRLPDQLRRAAHKELKERQLLLRRIAVVTGQLAATGLGANGILRQQRAMLTKRLTVVHQTLANMGWKASLGKHEVLLDSFQSRLRTDDIVVRFVVGVSAIYAWVIDSSNAEFIKLDITPDVMRSRVRQLRCEILYDLADDQLCSGVQNAGSSFDLLNAHDLYIGLFGKLIERINKSKRLFVMPDDELHGLPWSGLITKETKKSGEVVRYWAAGLHVHWFDHALSILPSISMTSSKKRLQSRSKRGHYLGIGNTLRAKSRYDYSVARSLRHCAHPAIRSPKTQCHLGVRRAARSISKPPSFEISSSGQLIGQKLSSIDVAPLPCTAVEVCLASERFAPVVDRSLVLLADDATEAKLRSITLDQFSILHFATHGLLPSPQMGHLGLNEPALVLTEPANGLQRKDDDGLLSASEVAEFELDADMVILSACDTASGATTADAPFTGLIQSFLVAGARSVVASLWPINSRVANDFSSKLVTNMQLMSSDSFRSEAVRNAIATVRRRLGRDDNGKRAHPRYWAAFVLVESP